MGLDVMNTLLRGDVAAAERVAGVSIPAGWPVELKDMLRVQSQRMRRDPSTQPWLGRMMVLRADGRTVVGNAGFHMAPDARGVVEIGYSVQPQHRRRGYAQEAVEALLAWAEREHGIRRFAASVSPRNEPSLGLVRKVGFVEVGRHWDPIDGEELVFELRR